MNERENTSQDLTIESARARLSKLEGRMSEIEGERNAKLTNLREIKNDSKFANSELWNEISTGELGNAFSRIDPDNGSEDLDTNIRQLQEVSLSLGIEGIEKQSEEREFEILINAHDSRALASVELAAAGISTDDIKKYGLEEIEESYAKLCAFESKAKKYHGLMQGIAQHMAQFFMPPDAILGVTLDADKLHSDIENKLASLTPQGLMSKVVKRVSNFIVSAQDEREELKKINTKVTEAQSNFEIRIGARVEEAKEVLSVENMSQSLENLQRRYQEVTNRIEELKQQLVNNAKEQIAAKKLEELSEKQQEAEKKAVNEPALEVAVAGERRNPELNQSQSSKRLEEVAQQEREPQAARKVMNVDEVKELRQGLLKGVKDITDEIITEAKKGRVTMRQDIAHLQGDNALLQQLARTTEELNKMYQELGATGNTLLKTTAPRLGETVEMVDSGIGLTLSQMEKRLSDFDADKPGGKNKLDIAKIEEKIKEARAELERLEGDRNLLEERKNEFADFLSIPEMHARYGDDSKAWEKQENQLQQAERALDEAIEEMEKNIKVLQNAKEAQEKAQENLEKITASVKEDLKVIKESYDRLHANAEQEKKDEVQNKVDELIPPKQEDEHKIDNQSEKQLKGSAEKDDKEEPKPLKETDIVSEVEKMHDRYIELKATTTKVIEEAERHDEQVSTVLKAVDSLEARIAELKNEIVGIGELANELADQPKILDKAMVTRLISLSESVVDTIGKEFSESAPLMGLIQEINDASKKMEVRLQESGNSLEGYEKEWEQLGKLKEAMLQVIDHEAQKSEHLLNELTGTRPLEAELQEHKDQLMAQEGAWESHARIKTGVIMDLEDDIGRADGSDKAALQSAVSQEQELQEIMMGIKDDLRAQQELVDTLQNKLSERSAHLNKVMGNFEALSEVWADLKSQAISATAGIEELKPLLERDQSKQETEVRETKEIKSSGQETGAQNPEEPEKGKQQTEVQQGKGNGLENIDIDDAVTNKLTTKISVGSETNLNKLSRPFKAPSGNGQSSDIIRS